MGRRAPRNDTGRRSKLTPEVHEQIVRLVSEGNYAETAAAAVGVSRRTLWQWMQQGEEALGALERGEDLPERARVYARFAHAVTGARARGETQAVAVVQKVMEGGFLIEEEPLVTKDGIVVYDPVSGEMLYKRKYAQPDGKLALEYLSRTAGARFGRTPVVDRVEVTGEGGGAVQVETTEVVQSLAAKLAALQADRRLEIEATPEDVVDAEVIEDGER